MMNQNQQKAMAARAALDFVEPGTVLGVGTGTTANLFIDALAETKPDILGAVASSEASRLRLQRYGIQVFELNDIEVGALPIYVDGADEIDSGLRMIKGGGGALTREKIVASVAGRFICIADASKRVERLGGFPLPVEVLPMARAPVMRALAQLGGRPLLREGFVTDNGALILDVYDLTIDDPVALESAINQLPGVICNGLFARRRADVLVLGTGEGVKLYHAP